MINLTHINELRELLLPTTPSEDLRYQLCLDILSPKEEIECHLQGRHLNFRIGKWKLSPLHLCALTGRLQLAEKLLQQGAAVEIPGYKELLPLHFAAMRCDQAMLNLMLRYNPQLKEAKSNYGLSIAHIQHWTTPPEERPELKAFLLDENGVEKPLNAREFKNLTSSMLVSHSYLPTLKFLQICLNPWVSKNSACEKLGKLAMDFKEPFKNVLIHKDPLVGNTIGWDIVARKALWPRDLACLYGGVIVDDSPNIDRFYRMDPYSALHYRGPAAMINHGFPNTITMDVAQNGIPVCITQVIEPITQHERLCWDYGGNYTMLYTRPFVELRYKEMTHFFKELPPCEFQRFVNIMDRAKVWMTKMGGSSEFEIMQLDFEAKYRYLATTPLCSVQLIFADLCTGEELKMLWENPRFRELSLMDENPNHLGLKVVPEVFKVADKIHSLQKEYPEAPIEKLYIELCRIHSVCATNFAFSSAGLKMSKNFFPRLRELASSVQILQNFSTILIDTKKISNHTLEEFKASLLKLSSDKDKYDLIYNLILVVKENAPDQLDFVKQQL